MSSAPQISAPTRDLPDRSQRAGSAKTSPVRDLLALTERPEVISFAGGLPAPELFDLDGIRASFDAVLTSPGVLQYSTSEGSAALREEVARRYTADGLETAASDLIITTGSQQGLGLLATSLIDPGDTILVEEPCYLAALQTFALAGARVIGIPTAMTVSTSMRWTERRTSTLPGSSTRSRRSRTPPGARTPSKRGGASPRSRSAAASASSRTSPTGSCATRVTRSRRWPRSLPITS